MEGVGCSLVYIIKIFEELSISLTQIALAGGGVRTPGWSQIIADITQLPVSVYAGQETVTHGLFAYSCLALDNGYSFEDSLLSTFDEPSLIYPNQSHSGLYRDLFEKYKIQADLFQ
jgi:sugar (pentulose or hexulose) kinase